MFSSELDGHCDDNSRGWVHDANEDDENDEDNEDDIAFDIETTGLNPDEEGKEITVACTWGKNRNNTYFFTRPGYDREANIENFCKELDSARRIYGFNADKFDLPWVVKKFNIDQNRASQWFLKLFDYFQICKLVFDSSCSLNNLLKANGMTPKISSGMQAVIWANTGEFEKLGEYCLDDARLTWLISIRKEVVLPLTRQKPVVYRKHNGSWNFKQIEL